MSTEHDANYFGPRHFSARKPRHLQETEKIQSVLDFALEELARVNLELFNLPIGNNLQNIPQIKT